MLTFVVGSAYRERGGSRQWTEQRADRTPPGEETLGEGPLAQGGRGGDQDQDTLPQRFGARRPHLATRSGLRSWFPQDLRELPRPRRRTALSGVQRSPGATPGAVS